MKSGSIQILFLDCRHTENWNSLITKFFTFIFGCFTPYSPFRRFVIMNLPCFFGE